MKRILSVVTAALLFASCSKSDNNPKDNYFVFGYEGAVCALCNSIHPSNMTFLVKNAGVYQLKDSLIFPDAGIESIVSDANFSTTPMDNNSYLIANAMADSFPSFLLNSPDSTYGLSSTNFGSLVFAVKQDGIIRKWWISWDTTTIPVQIRPYIAHVLSTIDTLYPPFRAMEHP